MKKLLMAAILLTVLKAALSGQEQKQKIFTLNGYLTSMQSAMFESLSDNIVYENLVHNRLNFTAYLNQHITFETGMRNRLFMGDMAKAGAVYSDMISADQGFADLSWNIVTKNSFFFNTTIDRIWLDFNFDKFQARIGRQRINWGQTFVWNPNDIFNAYSFFDFDYVERPGSDAVRLQYYPSSSSAAEIAAKVDSDNDVTAAGLYRFSKWGYDIQFLAGLSNGADLVAGTGWSGSVGNVSFRGEGTWFQPSKSFGDTTGTGLFTIGADKLFKNNSTLQFQVMYCNKPLELNNFNSFYSGNLSSKDLAFSKFSAFGQYSFSVTPLVTISLSAMWFPDLEGYFAGPAIDFSLAENIDFSLLWQHFDAMMGGIRTKINIGFLRFKYSF